VHREALDTDMFEGQRKTSSESRSTLPIYYDHLSVRLLVAGHGGLITLFALDIVMFCTANGWMTR